jgi:hypothetical protein
LYGLNLQQRLAFQITPSPNSLRQSPCLASITLDHDFKLPA